MFDYSIFYFNYVVLLNLHLQSHEICSSLFVIILDSLTCMSFVSFGMHIFGDKKIATFRTLI